MLTMAQLSGCFPATPTATLAKYLDPLNRVIDDFHINTPLRIRAFLAQIGHESGEFKFTAENLNYSAEGLRKVFKKYFPNDALAKKYARKPEKIANRVYANRMGNGDEASGDGWRYRGRGLIQVTGKRNYTACMAFLGVTDPAYLETPEGAVRSAAWFWAAANLNTWADARDMMTITRKINGGLNGYDHRLQLYNRSKAYIY